MIRMYTLGFPVLQSEAVGRYLRQESVQHGDQILRLSLAAEGQWPLPGSSDTVRGALPRDRHPSIRAVGGPRDLVSGGSQGDSTYRVNQCEQWGQGQSVRSDVQEVKDKIIPARGLLGGWQRFGVDAWEESERESS